MIRIREGGIGIGKLPSDKWGASQQMQIPDVREKNVAFDSNEVRNPSKTLRI